MNEAQLRAALRDGEGDVPDAAAIISRAQRARDERRRVWRSTAGGLVAAAAVAGIAVGITRLGDDSGAASGSSAAGGFTRSPAATRPDDAVPGATRTFAAGGIPGAGMGQDAVPAIRCPARPGVATGSTASTITALFRRPVAGISICVYHPESRSTTLVGTLSGSASRVLAAALERGSAPPPVNTCMPVRFPTVVELLARDKDGRALPRVAITGRCGLGYATNGSTERVVRLGQPALAPVRRALAR